MANRSFQQTTLSLVKRVATLYPIVSVGVAGAVTLNKRTFPSCALGAAPATGSGYNVGDGQGTRSVTRNATGKWTIVLNDVYQYLMGVVLFQTANATGVPTAAQVGVISSTNPSAPVVTGVGTSIVVQFVDFAGSAVDPANGDFITLQITSGDASES